MTIETVIDSFPISSIEMFHNPLSYEKLETTIAKFTDYPDRKCYSSDERLEGSSGKSTVPGQGAGAPCCILRPAASIFYPPVTQTPRPALPCPTYQAASKTDSSAPWRENNEIRMNF